VPGRYQFSIPERQSRDGWFRIGSLDITTTAFLVLAGVVSMFWYAITTPNIFSAITLAFFWFVGHRVEDQVGRKRFTILIVAMTIIPAVLVTVAQLDPDKGVYGLNLLALALLVVFALDNPNATSFFGIPIWVFAAVYVGIMILQYIGDGMYESLVMGIGVILVALGGARQYGMLGDLDFIPRVGGSRAPKKKAAPHSAIEELELNQLLDKINASGMGSLSKTEKARLNELSKKLRGS
jgi:hypothetical protein